VTWDYRCPFARNAHEHLLAGLKGGAGWDVEFVPFSLNQVHVAEGAPDVWDDPSQSDSLLAMEAGIVVRDTQPDLFPQVHLALFAARHDQSRDLRERDVIEAVLTEQAVDPAAVFEAIDEGWPLAAFRKEHEAAASDHRVWGVPTFIVDGNAVFVRLMSRPGDDAGLARQTIDRVVDLAGGWSDLNEFKHTSIPR
jgi:hypothetical protein